MKNFVSVCSHRRRVHRDIIDGGEIEFFDHHDGAVADLRRPVLQVLQEGLQGFLYAPDCIDAMKRAKEILVQPLTSANCTAEIQFIKYRELIISKYSKVG